MFACADHCVVYETDREVERYREREREGGEIDRDRGAGGWLDRSMGGWR